MADYTGWLKRCVYRRLEQQETVLYQGLGPGNTAFLFYGQAGLDEAMLADCFARHGGKYGQKVDWLFQRRGQILVSKLQSGVDENTLVLEGLGAGADDVRFDEGDLVEILTKPHKVQEIADILELEDIMLLKKGVVWLPSSLVPVQEDAVITQILGLLDEMTAIDGIGNVTADFWIVDEKLEKFV